MLSEKKIPNRLVNQKSPYLLQHAHNPVDWYPWGEEAFQRAKSEDKPIFRDCFRFCVNLHPDVE